MRELIIQKLAEIEEKENIRILHAAESGSRAWGFPSPDSDYDVRFIYVRRKEDYLKLNKGRDVIELPINDLLDINGWDLDKTLKLLHGSNPTLFEWLSSPISYRKTEFHQEIQPLLDTYFSHRSGLHHYLSMAKTQLKTHLGSEMVRAKKYFYAIRPVLAAKWIIHRGTRPPVPFAALVEAELEEEMKPAVERLLDLKMNTPEIGEIPRVEELNRYLEDSIREIQAYIDALPFEGIPEWEMLDRFFLDHLDL